MRTYAEIDLDYDQFPIPDLSADIHWLQLPLAAWREKQKVHREAESEARRKTLPEDHQVLLVPADPTYRPIEQELWPVVNLAILDCLQSHPAAYSAVRATVRQTLDAHRGWTNPFPAPREYDPQPPAKKYAKRTRPSRSKQTLRVLGLLGSRTGLVSTAAPITRGEVRAMGSRGLEPVPSPQLTLWTRTIALLR